MDETGHGKLGRKEGGNDSIEEEREGGVTSRLGPDRENEWDRKRQRGTTQVGLGQFLA